MNLKSLLKENEGKQLEFKRNLTSPKNILQTIVAFSNTAGGTILIGVEDKTKNIIGIKNPLKEEERLANLLSENIRPMVAPSIEILTWRNLQLIKLEVYLSPMRPHYIKSKGLEKGTFIRIGSSNRNADLTMTEEIRREVLRKPFDESPLTEFNSEAIDFRVASELFSTKKPLRKKDLETLQLITKHQNKKVPTVAGMILFGKGREIVFPDAWIQCGLFKGTNKTNILDTYEIHSYPIIAIDEALDFVKKHAQLSYEITGLKRTETWNKPLIAIREAIINAVIHADYSQRGAPIRLSIFDDRIEVENPGLLVSGLTIEEMQQGVSKLRNKNIARTFKELKLVEQWGSGVLRIIESCKEYGLSPPKFEEIATHFRVTIYTIKSIKASIESKDVEILNLLKEEKEMRTKEISEAIKLTPKATITRMQGLITKGLVSVLGKSARDPQRKYILTQEGEKELSL